jgi:hypothetical protein
MLSVAAAAAIVVWAAIIGLWNGDPLLFMVYAIGSFVALGSVVTFVRVPTPAR